MEVKTDPSVSPDTPTPQLCRLGTLLRLTEIRLPVCERLTGALSRVAAGPGSCPWRVSSTAPGTSEGSISSCSWSCSFSASRWHTLDVLPAKP